MLTGAVRCNLSLSGLAWGDLKLRNPALVPTRWSGHLDEEVSITFLTALGDEEGFVFVASGSPRHRKSVSMRSIGRLCNRVEEFNSAAAQLLHRSNRQELTA